MDIKHCMGRVAFAAIVVTLVVAINETKAADGETAQMERCIALGGLGAHAMDMRHDNVPVIEAINQYPNDPLAKRIIIAAYDDPFVFLVESERESNVIQFENKVQVDCLKGRL